MSDNISKDVFHCVLIYNQKTTFTERIKIQANATRPDAENRYIDHQEITIIETQEATLHVLIKEEQVQL